MTAFEDIKAGARFRGLDTAGVAEIVQVTRFGPDALNLVFRVNGRVGERLVYRGEEATFDVLEAGRTYGFDADGSLLRLASEAYRLRLAHLFDPYLAVSASQIEALPHQITAVYGEMLPRQPLRFLLADDPGAGKTIMAGLLIKELLIRGDLERCMIVAPGGLVEQWQEEMSEKFGISFDILSRDQIENSVTGNPFAERSRLIVRLDMAARSDDLKAKLQAAPDWDLIICDEAHRMAASYFGGEVKETQRHKLGKLLGTRTRNFLLMSATPHNGKEADFQLFMGLLDADRFEGRFREGVHKADVSDMMRRLTKEELYRFDGTPLFPERRAYTAGYELSSAEAALYTAVTTYVREEMNRADRSGDGKRQNNVGFALQILQRRLASSPAAIHRSLERRRKRLEDRLQEEKLARHSGSSPLSHAPALPSIDADDLEDVPGEEAEAIEDQIADQATAAATLAELEAEIIILRDLEAQALRLKLSGQDAKWRELETVLDDPIMLDQGWSARSLVAATPQSDQARQPDRGGNRDLASDPHDWPSDRPPTAPATLYYRCRAAPPRPRPADPVCIATEGALWGSVKAHGFLPETVIVSDDAGQFDVGRHALCWVHAERLVHKLDTFTDLHRTAQNVTRELIWWFYGDLKAYRADPTARRRAALRARFARIFKRRTGFATLDRLLERLHANKPELLMVLDRPEIPLHTNGSENDIRCQVTKRKVSGGTRSDVGRDCRDAFLGLAKTCAKLGSGFWDYLGDRLAVPGCQAIPLLPALVGARCRSP